jgi:hypothetical protein
MTEQDTQRHAALAQLDATLAVMRRLRELATELEHGLEQAREAMSHRNDTLWEAAPEATAALAWKVAQVNATDAIAAADELTPASKGKAMPEMPKEEAPSDEQA